MLFYYFIELVDKGIKYLTAKKDYKEPVQDILSKLSNDNSFIDKVSDMLDTKRGIDNTTADKIIKFRDVLRMAIGLRLFFIFIFYWFLFIIIHN